MSYTNMTNADCKCEAVAMPEPSMADIMKEVSFLAEQNNLLIRRIRAFLTGTSENQNERSQEPRCFREELMKARYETNCVNEELGKLVIELGLP